MCFQKKSTQTLWHKNMVHKLLRSRRWRHAHTYCTLSCQQHSFHPPMGESFFSDGGWRFSAWAGQHRHVSDLRCKWLGCVFSQAVHLSSHRPSGEQAGWRQDAGQQVDLWTALMKPRKSLRWSSPHLALIPPLPVIFKRTDDGTKIEMIFFFFSWVISWMCCLHLLFIMKRTTKLTWGCHIQSEGVRHPASLVSPRVILSLLFLSAAD